MYVWSCTVDGGEETSAQVMVQVLVLAHLEHFIPLLYWHLVLNAFSRLLLVTDLLPAKLNTPHNSHYIPLQDCVMIGCGDGILPWDWSAPHGRPGKPICTRALGLLELLNHAHPRSHNPEIRQCENQSPLGHLKEQRIKTFEIDKQHDL